MIKKKWFWIVGAIAIIVAGVFLYKSQIKKQIDNDVITIGAILPLTGTGSVAGKYLKEGIDLAFLNLNKSVNIKLIYEDSKSLPNQGVVAYKKLKDIDHAKICVSALSSVTMSIIPIINSNLPVVSTLITYPNITEKSKFLYRNFINSTSEAFIMANFIRSIKGFNKVSVIYNNDEGGIGSKLAFEEAYKKLGGALLYEESYPANLMDFKNTVLKLNMNKQSQALYLIGYGKSLGLMVKQIREAGIVSPIYTMSQFGANDARDAAGLYAQSVIYTSPGFQFIKDKIMSDFVTAYKVMYNKAPNFISAFGYETGLLLIEAVKNMKDSNNDITIALGKAETIGLNGSLIKFNSHREIDTQINIVMWNGSEEIVLQ